MDPERFTSAVRLELRPGEWVLRRRAEKKLRGDTATLLAPDSIDYSKEPAWLPSEIWEDPL
jgi:hypothetical protein